MNQTSPKKRAQRACANAITNVLVNLDSAEHAEAIKIRDALWEASKADEVEHIPSDTPIGLCDCNDNACVMRRVERRKREGLCTVCGKHPVNACPDHKL